MTQYYTATALTKTLEEVLEHFDVFLKTDDFNTPHDFIEALLTRIAETGE